MTLSIEQLQENLKAWETLSDLTSMGVTIADSLDVIKEEFSLPSEQNQYEKLVGEMAATNGEVPKGDWPQKFFMQGELVLFSVGWQVGILEIGLNAAHRYTKALKTYLEIGDDDKKKDLFTFSFITLLEAHLPMTKVLDCLVQDLPFSDFKRRAEEMSKIVNEGQALAPYLQNHQDHLTPGFYEAFVEFETHGEIEPFQTKLLSGVSKEFLMAATVLQSKGSNRRSLFYLAFAKCLLTEPILDAVDSALIVDPQQKDFWLGWKEALVQEAGAEIEHLRNSALSLREKKVIEVGLQAGTLDLCLEYLGRYFQNHPNSTMGQ